MNLVSDKDGALQHCEDKPEGDGMWRNGGCSVVACYNINFQRRYESSSMKKPIV